MSVFDKYTTVVERTETIRYIGRVKRVQGLLIESEGPQAVVGEVCQIEISPDEPMVWGEVVGLRGKTVQLMPFTEIDGIRIGSRVVATGGTLRVPVGEDLLGRVLGPLGKPVDGRGSIGGSVRPVLTTPPDPLDRPTIVEQLVTGVRAIDGMVAVGKGQRLGIFSGSGIGKSTLIGMVARNTRADVNVIALIGERGREVREFIENDLGPEGLARSVIVVSTSNSPPLARLRGAFVATTIAEYFRDTGKDVMLLFDSVTRFARAQREIGLATGEAPATRGFPPSAFSLLPKLLERSGTGKVGSITGFYSILVEGDDMDEPVADTVRGILDGHLVLSRHLAQRYHYPAIDVLDSVSRLATKVVPKEVQEAAGYVRRLLATYRESEDLINVGAYAKGSNAEIDKAIEALPTINAFLQQQMTEKATIEETRSRLLQIAGRGAPDA
ncbi:MAG: FliI/YscN family ATPase [Spirochaetaceae bacterium]|nr:MAG: FliI/YscN family ATPase [Spirochaetaceae bacterium]